MNLNDLDESLRSENPCWKGYKPVGTKKKGGRTVPNCVPESAEKGVAEAREKFNQAVMQPGFVFSQEIDGVTYEVTNDAGHGPVVTVTDKNNEVIAQAAFSKHKTRPGLESINTYVEPAWQGEGIAANMYAVMRMLGANISPSTNQTDDGQAMWTKWNKQGDAKHIKSLNSKIKQQGVAEGQMPKTWHDVDKKLGKAVDKMSQAEKVKKGLAHPDTLKKKGVAEGLEPQVGDAVYYGKRLVGWFKGYSEHGKIITEPNEEEMGDEYSNRDVYWDPQDKITIKPEQGVAEGTDGWIGNPAKWKEAVLQAHGPGVVFKNYIHPGQPGKRSVNAINDAGKQVGVYQRHNKMGMVQPNQQGVAEGEKVGNMDADAFDDAMARLKKLAGAGPMKTVWDPDKRVYKNVPVNKN